MDPEEKRDKRIAQQKKRGKKIGGVNDSFPSIFIE